MKFVALFVALFASLPLLAAAVPARQYDFGIPPEDLTAFVVEDGLSEVSGRQILYVLTADEVHNCLAATKSEISDDPAAWLEYKEERKKITYTFVDGDTYFKHDAEVIGIIEEDTGINFWVCTASLPPICLPPPLTIPAIKKLHQIEGVIVNLQK
ncbi:hypothetical protein V8E54_003143 [Elaphomyces granulatus]|jgi:hypothetical protein